MRYLFKLKQSLLLLWSLRYSIYFYLVKNRTSLYFCAGRSVIQYSHNFTLCYLQIVLIFAYTEVPRIRWIGSRSYWLLSSISIPFKFRYFLMISEYLGFITDSKLFLRTLFTWAPILKSPIRFSTLYTSMFFVVVPL